MPLVVGQPASTATSTLRNEGLAVQIKDQAETTTSSRPNTSTTTTTTTLAIERKLEATTALPDDTYYWHARAKDRWDEYSAWSTVRSSSS